MSLGGVEECRVDDAVGYGLYAYGWGSVDSDDADVVAAQGFGCFGGSDGHTVVVGEYYVYVVVYPQQGVGYRQGLLLVPVGGH